jgi:hypothetical protein
VISFRYHIVSLVAVFLALAVGIVVGTTALNGPVTNDLRHQVDDLKKERTQLADSNKQLQGQVDTAGQFASTYGTRLVSDTLKDTSVLVVAMPGTPTGMADAVGTVLTAAGATITGRVELTSSFTDPAQGDSIYALATGDSHPMSITLPQTSDNRVLAAALLTYVLAGKGEATDLKSVLSSFAQLHMISSDPQGVEPAKNVVVIASGAIPSSNYASEAQLDVVSQFAVAGAKIVVAGDTGSAEAGGLVARVRDGAAKSTASTVDDANSAFGQVSTVLALAGTLKAQIGHYGTQHGADALFPAPAK